ncbi:MAG: succinyl-diaminopimelate desuccinylase [Rhodobacteraceae bacterium]|nr:succinyl-diaminopimelate desuccinylase [Paracoccaceae bacterium]
MSPSPLEAIDPVELTAELVRCPSVTPREAGALQLLERLLGQAGFRCQRVDRNGIPNLFARWGGRSPVFGFNGHTDVVPVGDVEGWSCDPFGGELRDGFVWGRGASDMKSGVAAFAAAAIDFVQRSPPDGSIILAITGDEEAVAADGTTAILDWMELNGHHMDACIVGEPSCPDFMGEAIKVGRRGSLSGCIELTGVQGHSAYPNRFRNPLTALAHLSHALVTRTLDEGTEEFSPSNFEISSIDTGNNATNVIPAHAVMSFNVRFNELHSVASLSRWIESEARKHSDGHGISASVKQLYGAESFITKHGPLAEMVAKAVEAETGVKPQYSTAGGTSDARFVAKLCPVVEFGVTSGTIHQVDERASIDEIVTLKRVYGRCLLEYFG